MYPDKLLDKVPSLWESFQIPESLPFLDFRDRNGSSSPFLQPVTEITATVASRKNLEYRFIMKEMSKQCLPKDKKGNVGNVGEKEM